MFSTQNHTAWVPSLGGNNWEKKMCKINNNDDDNSNNNNNNK